MRKLLSVFVLIALAPLTASAQETPRAELFIGYSYLHLDDGVSKKLGFLFPTGGSANGWNVSIDGNVNRWLGLVADFSGHYGAIRSIDFNRHSFLFGPRVSYRHKKFTPFAQILFGGAHDEDPNNSVTAFAWTTGGGVDVSVSKHFSVRLMQIEYARATSRGLTENNVRISAGLVLRFGKK
jgi:opacity protein-like surface antigen